MKNLFKLLVLALVLTATICLCSCSKEPVKKSEETLSPSPTMIIATAKVSQPTPLPTAEKPKIDYVDLITDNTNIYYSASSIEAENTSHALIPDFCFDGDLETRWSTVMYDLENSWICVEFGYPVIINGITLDENKTWGYVTLWEAQYYSESTKQWVCIYEGGEMYPGEYCTFDKDSEETYMFRLMFIGGTGNTVTINEIGISGLFAKVEENTPVRTPLPEKTAVIPSGVVNLSLDQIYSASSIESEGTDAALVPDLSFDGDSTTRWSSVFHDLNGSWLCVEFKSPVTVSGFVVDEEKAWGYVTSYCAQVWSDEQWKTVYEGDSFDKLKYIDLPEDITTSKFRLLFNDGQTLSETVTIRELSVYGKK